LQEITKELQIAGAKGELLAFAGDVRNEDDVKSAIKFTNDKFGAINVLVSNAGVGAFSSLTGYILINLIFAFAKFCYNVFLRNRN